MWVKIADSFTEQFEELGPEVMATHLAGLTYCARWLTDGHIPKSKAERGLFPITSPESAITLLVQHGYWKVTTDGYEIVGYLDDQPSKKDTEKKREADRFRQRRRMMHRSGDHSQCDPNWCKASGGGDGP